MTNYCCNSSFDQGPDFTSKAVDLAARELLTVAIPGQGLLLS